MDKYLDKFIKELNNSKIFDKVVKEAENENLRTAHFTDAEKEMLKHTYIEGTIRYTIFVSIQKINELIFDFLSKNQEISDMLQNINELQDFSKNYSNSVEKDDKNKTKNIDKLINSLIVKINKKTDEFMNKILLEVIKHSPEIFAQKLFLDNTANKGISFDQVNDSFLVKHYNIIKLLDRLDQIFDAYTQSKINESSKNNN